MNSNSWSNNQRIIQTNIRITSTSKVRALIGICNKLPGWTTPTYIQELVYSSKSRRVSKTSDIIRSRVFITSRHKSPWYMDVFQWKWWKHFQGTSNLVIQRVAISRTEINVDTFAKARFLWISISTWRPSNPIRALRHKFLHLFWL